jgi:hypothetical protein
MASEAFVQHSPWGADGGAEETQYGCVWLDVFFCFFDVGRGCTIVFTACIDTPPSLIQALRGMRLSPSVLFCLQLANCLFFLSKRAAMCAGVGARTRIGVFSSSSSSPCVPTSSFQHPVARHSHCLFTTCAHTVRRCACAGIGVL